MMWQAPAWTDHLSMAASKIEALSADWDNPSSEKRLDTFSQLELTFCCSALALRKMIEAHKLVDNFSSSNIMLKSFPSKRPIDAIVLGFEGFHQTDPSIYYDRMREKQETVGIKKICDLFIHSRFFIPQSRGGVPHSVLVNSTQTLPDKIVVVPLDEWTDLLRRALDNIAFKTNIKFKDDKFTITQSK